MTDPTERFLRRQSKEYEKFERHDYATRARTPLRFDGASELRGDVSSDEGFYPLNFGSRRR
jgi:hypothetical protein